MSFQQLVDASEKHFPDLKVKYKDQSKFMALLGYLLFFNKKFMSGYTTTIGSTVYFPSKSAVTLRPTSYSITMLHELVHVYDAKKYSQVLFSFLYLTPQALALLIIPLFFVLPWWSVLLMMAVCLSPLPSFFRMHFEKRAYLSSLYVVHHLAAKLDFKPLLDSNKTSFVNQFKGAAYYFMWPFSNLDREFDEALVKIKNNERPFEDPVFDILDDLIKVV